MNSSQVDEAAPFAFRVVAHAAELFKKKMEKVRRRNQREIFFVRCLCVCVYGCGFLERLGGYKSGPPA